MNFDPQENRTFAPFFKGGIIAAKLTLAGKGDDSLDVLGFKSSVKTKAFLKRCQTVRQAVDGFFAEFDAKPRDLVVIGAKGGLRLMASDGRAIRATELDELAVTYYAPLTAAENPAGALPTHATRNRRQAALGNARRDNKETNPNREAVAGCHRATR